MRQAAVVRGRFAKGLAVLGRVKGRLSPPASRLRP